MKNDILDEILSWSADRPAWQRDALRRLFTSEKIDVADINELTELCKAPYGLSSSQKCIPITKEHIGVTSSSITTPVTLKGVKHHHGVNALASEQELKFGQNLNIIFGWNAAGKSGYARILKKVCRSRAMEEILGNVLGGETPLKAKATITFQSGEGNINYLWNSEDHPPNDLSLISVFDSHCAPVYLGEKTDVAFRPFGLDLFDKLSVVCGEVRKYLEEEKKKLENTVNTFPKFTEGSRVYLMITSLSALTKVEDVKRLSTLTKIEKDRLKELQGIERDFKSEDPRKRANELLQKAERIKRLVEHIVKVNEIFSDEKLNQIRTTFKTLQDKKEALVLLRKKVLTVDLLNKTGEEVWRTMWEAAVRFSNEAYPGTDFPNLPQHANCPLCQQELSEDAIKRLNLLKEYVASGIQKEVLKIASDYEKQVRVFEQIDIYRGDINLIIDELKPDNSELIKETNDFLKSATDIQANIKKTVSENKQPSERHLQNAPFKKLDAVDKSLRGRADMLQKQNPLDDPNIISEFNDLTDRVALGNNLTNIIDEIERKKRIAAYSQAIEETATQAITRKSTELTKRLITDQLREAFDSELKELDFIHLSVEIRPVGGTRGALYHQLVFNNAPGISVPGVLSEGESRVLSLAAFLAELSTSTNHSAIIFDDPVSSLDHRWRERIAKRLVKEAKHRQVIVFTHEIVFLRALLDSATKQNVDCKHQYIERDSMGAGVPTANLPWIAARIKERIGVLNQKYQEAEKIFRTQGSKAYKDIASIIYGMLRETWEQGVSEILLADIIERYRPDIETKKVRYLHDILEEDCKAVEDGMTECSRWMVGHDEPSVAGTPFPSPDKLKEEIQNLEDWIGKIKKRRK